MNGMLGKILTRKPGLYFYVSYSTLGWFVAFVLIIGVLCIQSVNISLNHGPKEYPMFLDGKKLVFIGREPQSVTEAREILAGYDHKFIDGDRVLVPEADND